MHILSPETNNCPSWISGRAKMTIENISWSISTEDCCRPGRCRTRNFLITSRTRIHMSHWGRHALRKNAYSNILKILPLKNESFQIKKIWYFFHISAQNIDCGYPLEPPRRGGSNGYPQSMFLSRIKKIMFTPLNPSFIIYKWGLRGTKLYRHVFVMWETASPGIWII